MPYVAVVDPESGALLRRWTGPAKMTSETIMDKREYCITYYVILYIVHTSTF